jgi:hypothetical protein
MAYQIVDIKINKKTGKMSVEGDGFIGTQCDVLSEVEASLGTITKTEDKAERYQYRQPEYLPNQLA